MPVQPVTAVVSDRWVELAGAGSGAAGFERSGTSLMNQAAAKPTALITAPHQKMLWMPEATAWS